MISEIPVVEFTLGKGKYRENKADETKYQKPHFKGCFTVPDHTFSLNQAVSRAIKGIIFPVWLKAKPQNKNGEEFNPHEIKTLIQVFRCPVKSKDIVFCTIIF